MMNCGVNDISICKIVFLIMVLIFFIDIIDVVHLILLNEEIMECDIDILFDIFFW